VSYSEISSACTGIRLTAQDGSVVYGRTLEFALPLPTDVIFVPEGYNYTGTTKPNSKDGKKWTVKYAYTGVAPINYDVAIDGINSKGLAAGTFLFPNYANYQQLTASNISQSIAPWEVVAYILSQYATIDEVKQGLSQVNVVAVKNELMQNEVPPVHYIAHDASGKSLVIEFVNGKLVTYDAPLGVITNSPTYDWHITNLSNYVNLNVDNAPTVALKNGVDINALGQGSGMVGMPGDFTPPARFVRAAIFSSASVTATSAADGIFHLFHILNQFDIPKGVVRGKAGSNTDIEYTQWTSAYDLKGKKMYFKTYENPQIKMLDLNKMDPKSQKVERFPMDAGKEGPKAIELLPNI
jgi:choloylglycine hydrolase